MQRSKMILGLAVLATSPAAHAAINWTYNGTTAGSNSWANTSSWSAVPAFDGTEDAGFSTSTLSANRTLTLDGTKAINSLSAITSGNNFKYTMTPGTGGVIQLTTGNLTIDGNGTSSGRPVSLTNVTVQIGDGITEVTNAVWDLKNSHASKSTFELGAIKGIAGTVIKLTGNNAATFAGSSNDFFGVVRQEQYDAAATSAIRLNLNANNALGGAGSKLVIASTIGASPVGAGNLYFNTNATTSVANSTTHEMDVQFDVNSGLAAGLASGYTSTTPYSIATLNGNLSGAGTIAVGVQPTASSVMAYGRIIVNGENNTASGNVSLRGGRLQVDGTWTGGGNFAVSRGLLTGTGSIGLASSNSVAVAATGSYNAADPYSIIAGIAPGDAGVVGTLSVGTIGNSNSLAFNNSAGASGGFDRLTQFLVDIDALTADRLNVNGDVTIGTTQVQLAFNQLSAPTAAQYVLMSWTGNLTGTFPSVVGLPDDYELQYTSNQLLLVNPNIPEPTSIAGLAILGGMLVRRRRGR